jgi:integrase
MWESLNFERREIHITDNPKHKLKTRVERIVPMNEKVYEALYPYRKETGYIFHSLRKGKDKTPYVYNGLVRLQRALRNAGLPEEDAFQRLRRSFCSMLVNADVPIEFVAKYAGHTVQVAQQHYVKIAPRQEHVNRI